MHDLPKILYVIDSTQPGPFFGGAELHVADCVTHIHRDRFNVLCASPNAEFLKYLNTKGLQSVHTYVLPQRNRFIRDMVTFFDMYKLFRETRPDIVHLHKLRSSVWGRMAAYFAGVPARITTLHGAPSFWKFGWLRNHVNRILNTLTTNHFSDYTIALSEVEKRALIEDGILPGKIMVIFSGLFQTERFTSILIAKRRTNAILAIGRLSWEKDFSTLVMALREIVAVLPNTTLHIVGDGPERNSLQDLINKLPLTNNVVFHGAQSPENISSFLANADVLVIPSLWESFPYVALEAMFSGLPIVATSVGGLPEIVGEGNGAILVPSRNAKEMSTAILAFLTNQERREEAGAYNRERASRLFTGERMMLSLEALYMRLLSDVRTKTSPASM